MPFSLRADLKYDRPIMVLKSEFRIAPCLTSWTNFAEKSRCAELFASPIARSFTKAA